MSGPIEIEIEQRGGWDVVRYAGPIDEAAATAVRRLPRDCGPQVVLNLRDVHYVDSAGTKTWILFLKDFTTGREVAYEECSTAVVAQMNMLFGFHAGCDVRSVYVPFACEACGRLAQELFEKKDFPTPGGPEPERACKGCGAPARMADAPDDYFFFTVPPQKA